MLHNQQLHKSTSLNFLFLVFAAGDTVVIGMKQFILLGETLG